MHPFLGSIFPSMSVMASDTTTFTEAAITTSATAYNNVTPVELIASTAYDAVTLTIRTFSALNVSGGRSSTVFEIMAGGAGSEYTIIGPVSVGGQPIGGRWTFPIFIPAGTRLSVRVRSARLSAALNFSYWLGYAMNRDCSGLPQRWVAYGLNDNASSDAQGTIVAPGNAAWGSWTSLTTSTTYAHDLWLPVVDNGTQTAITAYSVRTRWAIASTTDAATMATNASVWHGPWGYYSTTEQMGDGYTQTTQIHSRNHGGLNGPNGIFYHPTVAGSAVSVAARASGAPTANQLGCSILAAI